jgi:predicted ATPase
LERTLALCDANPETVISYRHFGTDDQARAFSFLASTLLLLGYPDRSAAAAEQALARARAMGLAFTTVLALSQVALLGVLGGDTEASAAHADKAIAYTIEHSLSEYEHRARFIQGALLAQSGDPRQGIEIMRNAMAAAEANSARNFRTLYLGHVACAHASLGQTNVGLGLLEEAIQTVETTSERFFEAELYRLRGGMLLTLGKKGEAEAALRQALAIAQQQQARWWELRAASSLGKHWRDEGKYVDARSVLEPAYTWFTEGFDTPDLARAKALLEELRDL